MCGLWPCLQPQRLQVPWRNCRTGCCLHGPVGLTPCHVHAQVHGNGPVLDDEILADPEVQKAIQEEGTVQRSLDITNEDRAAFGRVGGAVARLHGDSGFAGSLSFDLQVGSTLPRVSSVRTAAAIGAFMRMACMQTYP